jgi:catechol 2,3-dioxygenase-like lactoylglutathione lyase family enzyme
MAKLDHLSLPVSDWKISRDWYVAHLGFVVEFEAPEGGSRSAGVAAVQDDAGLTIFLDQTAEPIQSGQATYTFQVEDVDALFARLDAAGVRFLAAPGKQFWGYGAVLADPDGHVLHLWDETSMREKG